jgi:outer membrane protein insertion porin family
MRHILPVFLAFALLATSACQEDGNVRVKSISFQGVQAVSESQLRNALATREGTSVPIIGKLLPWATSKSPFDRSRFEADLERIKAFYADRGYPDAAVSSFDVKLNDKQDAVDVTLNILEGEPITLADVKFVGFEVLPLDRRKTLLARTGIKLGQARDRQSVAAGHEVAINELRDQGYPYARVATAEAIANTGHQTIVTFTADPGPLSHIGPIEIVGAKSVSENQIRRQLRVKPGDLYRRSLVQDSQRRLYAMSLFQFVNIETVDPERQSPEVPLRITIAEGRHQRINGGVGYGSDEHARVEGEYHHVNFFGGGRSAGAHARYSRLDRGIRLDFLQPYFFAPTLSLTADGQRWDTFTPAYSSLVTGGRLSLVQKPNAKTVLTFSFSSEQTISTISDAVLTDPSLYPDLIAIGLDPRTGSQSGTIGSVGFDWQRTTTNSVLDATRGYQFVVHAEDGGHVLGGSFHYTALAVDGRQYTRIGEKLVWANRLQFGNIYPSGGDPAEVPFSKKYFLGGATSIRGWGRYEVSPLGGEGLPIGGNALFAFSTEARALLTTKMGGVLFLDGGNVWANRAGYDLNDLRYAVGLGFRYATPVGPIRFDYGYQLNQIPGLVVNGAPEARRWRLHFSIGQAF